MARPPQDFGERVPPHDLQAERSVISALLSEEFADAWREVERAGLRAEHFYRKTNVEIFRRISFLAWRGIAPDVVTLADSLAGGPLDMERDQVFEYLANTNGVSYVANAFFYAKRLVETAALRSLIRTAHDATTRAYEGEGAGEVLSGLSEDLRDLEADAGTANGLPTVSGTEFLAIPPPPRRLLVAQDVLGIGEYLLLIGEPKKGKSLLALDLAVSLARNADCAEEWCGFTVFGPRRTLFLVGEGGRSSFYTRFEKRTRILKDEEKDRLVLWFPSPRLLEIDSPTEFATLRNAVVEKGIELLILDPLAHFHTGDENSNTDMGKIAARFIELKEATGVALLVVHHARKNTQDMRRGSPERARGASSLWGAADGGIVFEHEGDDEDDQERRMTFSLRNAESPPEARIVALDSYSLRFEVVVRNLGGRPATHDVGVEDILEAIKAKGEATYGDLAEVLPIPKRSLQRWLPDLLRRGAVDRRRDSRRDPYLWSVPEETEPTEDQRELYPNGG